MGILIHKPIKLANSPREYRKDISNAQKNVYKWSINMKTLNLH